MRTGRCISARPSARRPEDGGVGPAQASESWVAASRLCRYTHDSNSGRATRDTILAMPTSALNASKMRRVRDTTGQQCGRIGPSSVDVLFTRDEPATNATRAQPACDGVVNRRPEPPLERCRRAVPHTSHRERRQREQQTKQHKMGGSAEEQTTAQNNTTNNDRRETSAEEERSSATKRAQRRPNFGRMWANDCATPATRPCLGRVKIWTKSGSILSNSPKLG